MKDILELNFVRKYIYWYEFFFFEMFYEVIISGYICVVFIFIKLLFCVCLKYLEIV